MRAPPLINALTAITLCLVTSGCIGFINGYMADRAPERRNDSPLFAALKADTGLLTENSTNVAPAMRPLFVTLVVADMPISLATDLTFSPLIGIGYLVRHNKPPKEISDKTSEPAPSSAIYNDQ
jgi:hypothetical protein